MNVHICFIVDSPAPPVIIERTNVQNLLVNHIGFGVQDLFVELVDAKSLADEFPQKKSVFQKTIDRLVSLCARDQFYFNPAVEC